MKILLLTLGGTIDAAAYPENSLPPVNCTPTEDQCALRVLEGLAAQTDAVVTVQQICNKDSKFLSDRDLAALEHAIIANASASDRIIVTCGTDRMTETAQDLQARLRVDPACPVVLTGAILPLANGAASDGQANLRLALFAQPDAPAGIYVAMHDLFLPCQHIRKDFDTRRFVYR